VPAAADVARLLGLLSHFGDHRIAGDSGEKAVDIDRRKTLGKGDVLLRGEILVPEEDNAVLTEGAADLGDRVVQRWAARDRRRLSQRPHAVIPARPG
jgi:hypothetical protein